MKCNRIVFNIIITIGLLFSVLYSQKNTQRNDLDREPLKKINTSNLTGERIFFVKKRVVSGLVLGDIYSMNSSGNDQQQLTDFSDRFFATELPEISRDGKRLTFISNYEGWKSAFYLDAFIADLQSGSFKRVTGDERPFPSTNLTPIKIKVHDPHLFAVSPSAVRISFKGCIDFIPMVSDSMVISVPADEDIWVKAEIAKGKGAVEFIRVQAGAGERIDLTLGAGTISAESCSPTHNGQNIAVSVNYENPYRPFYKIGIWNESGMPIFTQDVGGHSLGGDTFPSYSPDGSMIAYATGEHTLNSLAVISTSNLSNPPTILVPGSRFGIQGFCSQPTWSPDGSEIVFVFTTINGLEIQSNLYKVPVIGGDPIQLTSYSWNKIVSKPSYSPDGSKIAFNHLQNNGGGIFSLVDLINFTYKSDIYYINENGGEAVALTNDGASIDPSWGNVSGTVGVDEEEKLPTEFTLSQNYPNPFNPSTTIKYEIPVQSLNGNMNVSLKVYDLLGREVATLVNKYQPTGSYKVEWNSTEQGSGVYFYQLKIGSYMETKKMIKLK